MSILDGDLIVERNRAHDVFGITRTPFVDAAREAVSAMVASKS